METIYLAQKLRVLFDERFPGNYSYVPLLAEIMGIHEKTVHSKLRGDTQFTLLEIYKIAKKLDIPVGEIFKENEERDKHSMEIYIHDYTSRQQNRILIPATTLNAYRMASSSQNSKYLVATNGLPEFLIYEYPAVLKFNYLKWRYFNKGREATSGISEISLSENDLLVQSDFCNYIRAFKRSAYLLNFDVMRFLGDELLFFFNINLLTKDEAEVIIDNYFKAIRSLENICNMGLKFMDEQEIHIFFSRILLSNGMCVIESDELNLAVMYAYFNNPVATTSYQTFLIFRDWFNSWLHSANLISASDPIQRKVFFENQYGYIDVVRGRLDGG